MCDFVQRYLSNVQSSVFPSANKDDDDSINIYFIGGYKQ